MERRRRRVNKSISPRHIFRCYLLCLYILNATAPRAVESPHNTPQEGGESPEILLNFAPSELGK
jgi:hypothetical protein